MREAIGGTWLFQIVILFILLFTGYMCFSINHSKAFNVKTNIVEAIEKNGGLDGVDLGAIMAKEGYRTTGSFSEGTGYNRDGELDSRNASVYISSVSVRSNPQMPEMTYYRVTVFYQLDIPVLRKIFSFKMSGDTKIISKSEATS